MKNLEIKYKVLCVTYLYLTSGFDIASPITQKAINIHLSMKLMAIILILQK